MVLITLIVILTVSALCTLISGISIKNNMNRDNELYHNGDTVIISEVNHFYTKSITVTEEASNPGDFDQTMNLYYFQLSCNSLPVKNDYQEFSEISTELPNRIFYLLRDSTITFHVCASSNDSASRAELLLLNDLSTVRNFNINMDPYIDFWYFRIGANVEWECDTYHYLVRETGYYAVHFILPKFKSTYNYTLKVDKKVIDVTSDLQRPVSNYTLTQDGDTCTFHFSMSTGKSCIIADIEQQNYVSEDHRYVHAHIQFQSRQGDIFHPFLGITITSAVMLIVVGGIILLSFVGTKRVRTRNHSQN